MDKIIRKIIKEELGLDDFSWTQQIQPFSPGSEFEMEDVCFDSDDECMVNVNKDSIIFKMSYDEWSEKVDTNDDNRYYLRPVLEYGRNYDGGSDYYEFDIDEFNYSGYQIGDKQKKGLQEILNLVGSKKSIEDIIGSDEMNSIEYELKYPPLKSFFDDLQSNYLSIVGYKVQENRWIGLSNYIWNELDSTGIEWESDRRNDDLTITIPKEELLQHNFKDLTQLLKNVSSVISDGYWSDSFYDDWDISGAEEDILYEFDRFIEKSIELLEEEGVLEKYKDFEDLIKSIGFSLKKNRSYWSGYSNTYELSNDEGYWFIKEIDYDKKMVTLSLYEDSNIYNTPKKSFRIPFNKISDYVNNYRLNLESKNRLFK